MIEAVPRISESPFRERAFSKPRIGLENRVNTAPGHPAERWVRFLAGCVQQFGMISLEAPVRRSWVLATLLPVRPPGGWRRMSPGCRWRKE